MEMRNRIERQIDQRTTMLAGVSHDLRTILTRFKLQLAMLGDNPEAEAMRGDVAEMQAMLEDYLAFAKGDSSEEIANVDVRAMLQDIGAQAVTSEKTVSMKLNGPAMDVPLRRNAFKRAVDNIVNNATRYADRVAITASKSDRWLTIEIEDDGPGIPTDEREEVFRPFYRLDATRNLDVGGTGLGLTIARDVVRGHGGDVTLGPSKLGGLKATIRVPV
jgi:two-component system osmolarity sensor histidine kinase EnvZ